ncbi:hypothetical protein M9H77_15444 [Catharanthus roseus]|uniref:Uncharacterized protein n=1 Tax=Catharanthus roseus TaxID=4058 RepID=A0ACC0AXV4_CATRO|nr:hypothetical protein M9H77_15444 [Catharanthus roseus]
MGSCASTPKGCVRVGSGLNLRKKHRRRRRRRTAKTQSFSNKLSKIEPSHPTEVSYRNPTFQGNSEAWYDPDTVIDSDCDDDFYSVQDDLSQLGSGSTVVTPRFCDNKYFNAIVPNDPLAKSSELSVRNLEANNSKGSSSLSNSQVQAESNCDEVKDPSQVDKPSAAHCVNESPGRVEPDTLHNCGLLPNSILPCLACASSSDEKNKSSGPHDLPNIKKRLSIKLSFKRKEGLAHSSLLSPRAVLQRPIAGSQIPRCPIEKKMTDCWSSIAPNTFRVRGQNYFRDKKKDNAPNCAAFDPFGVDVFISPRKIDHIARFVELPAVESSGEIPPILVVNLQIPLYPPAFFQSDYDGEGMSFVFYFKISDNYSKELPLQFQENIKRLIADEVEKIRSFPVDTTAPFRERLKILGRIVNVEDLQLTGAEKKLMNTYNEKPVLSRPQHQFYLGENYFEIDLDLHRFSFIARKGFEAFQDRLKHCILDFGLTIQGNKAEDLPECMLCCIRLKEIDYTNYNQLSF